MGLAQGHNAVMLVRLELVAPRSRVKHSTVVSCTLYFVCVSRGGFDKAAKMFRFSLRRHEIPPLALLGSEVNTAIKLKKNTMCY